MISGAMAILKSEAQRNEMSFFYEKYKSRLLRIAIKILRNEDEAADAVQDAFLKIADKPNSFFSLNDEKRIRYVSVVVKNASIDIYNKSKKIQMDELSEDIIYRNDESLIENITFDKISFEEILAFIDTLPEAQRNVLVLTFSSGLSVDEIGATLNITVSAVYKRLYLARKSVKKFIDERSKNNV